jgi:hypothetical protein
VFPRRFATSFPHFLGRLSVISQLNVGGKGEAKNTAYPIGICLGSHLSSPSPPRYPTTQNAQVADATMIRPTCRLVILTPKDNTSLPQLSPKCTTNLCSIHTFALKTSTTQSSASALPSTVHDAINDEQAWGAELTESLASTCILRQQEFSVQ